MVAREGACLGLSLSLSLLTGHNVRPLSSSQGHIVDPSFNMAGEHRTRDQFLQHEEGRRVLLLTELAQWCEVFLRKFFAVIHQHKKANGTSACSFRLTCFFRNKNFRLSSQNVPWVSLRYMPMSP